MKTSARLPRHRRVADPPRIVLTDRDQKILHAVYAYRLLTREQIERLLFAPEHGQDHPTKTSICRKRLKLLYHNRFLERIFVPVRWGAPASRPVYRLAKAGAARVAGDLGRPVRQIAYWGSRFDRQHRSTEISLLFLAHTLETNDFRIAVTLSAKAQGYQIAKWIDDTELKSAAMKDYVHVDSLRVAVVPDAYFVLDLGTRLAHFFVELDRATMDHRRWKRRIQAYRVYMESGRFQERYQTSSLRILTVTTSAARLMRLAEATAQAAGSTLAARFWFTTLARAIGEDVLGTAIWSVSGGNDSRPLIAREA